MSCKEWDWHLVLGALYVIVGAFAILAIASSIILYREEGHSVGQLVQQRIGARLEVVGVDTTYVISRQEHEYLLNQAKEQNSFLNTILTIVVTTLTFFAGGAGLFMWLIQKKYESMGEKYSALQSSLKSHRDDIVSSKREIESLRDDSINRMEHVRNSLQPILEELVKALDETLDKAPASDRRKDAIEKITDLFKGNEQAGSEGTSRS